MTKSQRQRILLEVPIASVEDAIAVQAGGGARLELNAALALGGLTPSLGMFLEVKRVVALPVVVMLRPRPGGFAYSDADFSVMLRDLDLFRGHGADAFAFAICATTALSTSAVAGFCCSRSGRVPPYFIGPSM
jgi:copper homeostasis protein